jgi:hypothetical protein
MFRSLTTLLVFASSVYPLDIENGQRYVLLATTKTGTMQKELDEAAAAGFRVVRSAQSGEIVVLLERVNDGSKFEYLLLSTTKTGTMQKELTDAGAKGFRLISTAVFGLPRPPILGGDQVVVLLERSLDPAKRVRHEYRLLATKRTSTLQKEVTESQAGGFELDGLLSRGEHMVIMHKAGGAIQ